MAKIDDIERINWEIDQITLRLMALTSEKREIEKKKQERYLYIVK